MIKVAIDWGSTSFRAYLFEGDTVIEHREANCGITNIAQENRPDAFEAILQTQVGDWLEPDDHLLLCGMITSVHGWIETAYIPCPLDCVSISRNLKRFETAHRILYFIPGVSQTDPHADVMRGEEVQLLGLSEGLHNDVEPHTVVMPGTHSKWATLQDGNILNFNTIATGELYKTLLEHTLIGQMAITESWCETTFLNAVAHGYNNSNVISQLFTARSSVLLNLMHHEQVSSYLSGLLIGSEIREGTGMSDLSGSNVTVVGSPTLTKNYLCAMNSLGFQCTRAKPVAGYPDITSAGFAAIIKQMSR